MRKRKKSLVDLLKARVASLPPATSTYRPSARTASPAHRGNTPRALPAKTGRLRPVRQSDN